MNGLILVIDDEPIIRSVAEAQLTDYGYEVILARDGQEAVEHYQKHMGKIDNL